MATEIYIHKMSEHMETARIIHWVAKEGDFVQPGTILMEIETDKATVELEAEVAGVLKGIRPGAKDGTEVAVGETLAFIAAADEKVPILAPLKAAKDETIGPKPLEVDAVQAQEGNELLATPVARRLARQLGIDLRLVKGTGPRGAISQEDVLAFTQSNPARDSLLDPARMQPAFPSSGPDPSASPEPLPPGDWLELSPMQRLMGERMLQSVQTAPQFSLSLSVDMTHLLEWRETVQNEIADQKDEKLSLTAFLIKAVATVLRKYPRVNASFVAGKIKLNRQVNIGVAMGVQGGLVVPVIRDSDQKALVQIARELSAYQSRTGEMRFSLEDLEGATFTISNLGMYGIELFRAIINPPQSAILAVGRMVKTPVALPDDSIGLRPLMNLTASFDHRVLDGLQGAFFLQDLKQHIEQPYRPI